MTKIYLCHILTPSCFFLKAGRLRGIFDECLTTLPPVSNLSGCWRQVGATVPYTALPYGSLPNSPAVMTRHLLTFLAYSCHTSSLLSPFWDKLTRFRICLCRLPPAFSHPFLLQSPFLFSRRVFLSSPFPSQHCLPCLVTDRLLLPRMHKSGISYAMPSCSKTLYILSD